MLLKKTLKNKGKVKGKGPPDNITPDNINEKLDTIIKLLNEISQKLPNRMITGEVIQQQL
jgi:hypothetical protein